MEKIRKAFREFFSLSRSEGIGFIIVSIFLLVAIVFNILSKQNIPNDSFDYTEVAQKLDSLQQVDQEPPPGATRSLFKFDPNTIEETAFKELDIPEKVKQNLMRYRQKGGKFKRPEDILRIYGMTDSLFQIVSPLLTFQDMESRDFFSDKKETVMPELFDFNPNKASEDTLKMLGFSDFAAVSLNRYISKGGVIREKADLLKIYGMSIELFDRISPFVVLNNGADHMMEKKEPQMIELNGADSAMLVSIPGIGPTYAARIIKYRKLLGGFYKMEQLTEVYGMTNELYSQISGYLKIDAHEIKKIEINLAEYSELRSHPYISPRQARMILDRRSAKGPLENPEELIQDTIFSKPEYERISHYLAVW